MGGFDIFCFLCAAGFSIPYEIESGEYANDNDEQDDDSKARHPEKLCSKDALLDHTRWLSEFRTVGQNRNATGLTQCYLSGRASAQDYGQTLIERGEHPNAQNLSDDYVNCYRNGDEENGDLPVHDRCFKILCEVFSQAQNSLDRWTPDNATASIPFELDPLFSCLASVREEHRQYLLLDHKFKPDQYFYIDPDRIYDYFDPLQSPNMPRYSVGTAATEVVLGNSTGSGFDVLPNELITQILDLIPQADLVSLMQASAAVRNHTKSNKFWMRRLHLDAPWLWECRQDRDIADIDWQKYYTAVMMQTFKPLQLAAKGIRVSGLANRRRIWHVCGQVLQLYLESNPLNNRHKRTSMFEEGVVCRYLPVVADQRNPQYTSDTSFFFNTQHEMRLAKRLKIRWNDRGALCGISFATDAGEVKFGDVSYEGAESVMNFESTDWVEKLVLNVAVVETWTTQSRYGVEKTHRRLAVTGMAVWQLSGSVTNLGSNEGYKRLLEPLPGHGIVGLKTRFSEDRITHLGLLEHQGGLKKARSIPDSKRLELLWADQLPPAELRFKDFFTGYWMNIAGWDLIPMHTLLFGSTDLQQSIMTGFGVSADFRCFEIYRSNGSLEQVGTSGSPMKVFLIDGPGGERIAGVEMTIGALPVGISLVTTQDRQATFGKRADNARHEHTSEFGFGVAGLYCSFAYNGAPENQLSSLGMIQSPNIHRLPMRSGGLADENGLLWEPRAPRSSWYTVGKVYGPGHEGEVAVCIDFSRPVARIEGLFPAPDWLDGIEIGGFQMFYGDDNPFEPSSHLGFPPQQWPKTADATPETLRAMQRHSGMSIGGARGNVSDTGKAHVLSDEETLEQPTTWTLGPSGKKLVAVTVWAGEFLHGLQFHAEGGNDSPRWGKCGGEPSAKVQVGGKQQIVGLKVILGSKRLRYRAGSLSPQAVQAFSDASQ